jgi:hypothetical protein
VPAPVPAVVEAIDWTAAPDQAPLETATSETTASPEAAPASEAAAVDVVPAPDADDAAAPSDAKPDDSTITR